MEKIDFLLSSGNKEK